MPQSAATYRHGGLTRHRVSTSHCVTESYGGVKVLEFNVNSAAKVGSSGQLITHSAAYTTELKDQIKAKDQVIAGLMDSTTELQDQIKAKDQVIAGLMDSTTELQDQIKVKDKVIACLVDIVELLEINYGITIDDQMQAFHNLMNIAQSVKDEERENTSPSSTAQGKYPVNVMSTRANLPHRTCI